MVCVKRVEVTVLQADCQTYEKGSEEWSRTRSSPSSVAVLIAVVGQQVVFVEASPLDGRTYWW